MADSVRIEMPDLADFARDLKAAPKELQRDLYREINSEAKGLISELRQSAGTTLPSAGGLNELVAQSTMRAAVRRGTAFGVTIMVRPKRGSSFSGSDLDKGFIGWRSRPRQTIEGGWFQKPWDEFADDTIDAIVRIVERIADRIHRG